MTDTPNRQPLSPAAQAVLDAYGNEVGGSAAITSYERRGITAALRAAADQVVPEENVDEADYDCLQAKWADQGKQEARAQFLAIASELAGAQPTNLTH